MTETTQKTRYFLYTCGRCETMMIVEHKPAKKPVPCPICKKSCILNKEIDEKHASDYSEIMRYVE